MLIVYFSSEYGDEFKVSGFKVMKQKSLDMFYKFVESKIKEDKCFYFSIGTHEYIKYDSLEKLKQDLTIKEITYKEFNVLNKLNLCNDGIYIKILDKD